jgi:hypothetical protein
MNDVNLLADVGGAMNGAIIGACVGLAVGIVMMIIKAIKGPPKDKDSTSC